MGTEKHHKWGNYSNIGISLEVWRWCYPLVLINGSISPSKPYRWQPWKHLWIISRRDLGCITKSNVKLRSKLKESISLFSYQHYWWRKSNLKLHDSPIGAFMFFLDSVRVLCNSYWMLLSNPCIIFQIVTQRVNSDVMYGQQWLYIPSHTRFTL